MTQSNFSFSRVLMLNVLQTKTGVDEFHSYRCCDSLFHQVGNPDLLQSAPLQRLSTGNVCQIKETVERD